MDIYSKLFFVGYTVWTLKLAYGKFRATHDRPNEAALRFGDENANIVNVAITLATVVNILVYVGACVVVLNAPLIPAYLTAMFLASMLVEILIVIKDIATARAVKQRSQRPMTAVVRLFNLNGQQSVRVLRAYIRAGVACAVIPYVLTAATKL